MNWNAIGTAVAIVGILVTGITAFNKLTFRLETLESKVGEVDREIGEINVDTIPNGIVAYFDLSDCPVGWRGFEQGEGRVVVATSSGSSGLSSRMLGNQGGSEQITLSINNLPRHSHSITLRGRSGNNAFVTRDPSWGYDDWVGDPRTTSTGNTGASQPFSNMPPFYVLTQCKKL
ncbi:hypothetical protein [Saccharospirillum mangrovi]|uniref:hypothetical protein n=1 Tax=Saccharospirillum mangrovi TaxID=2161747 RepID=UPI0013002451|nr:hypothetical protein [Saccharospirillum mangrovi]